MVLLVIARVFYDILYFLVMNNMNLFSLDERATILELVKKGQEKNCHILVTFRHKYGPTQLKRKWVEFIETLGFEGSNCVSWWTSSGTTGLLECEDDERMNVYGQWVLDDENKLLGTFEVWVLDDENKLLGTFEVCDEDILTIRDGFDAGTVTSAAMRAIRIGETGGEKE